MDKKLLCLPLKDSIFQSIIDALPVLFFWTDKNHVILGNNLKHARYYGASSTDEVVGMSMREWGKSLELEDTLIDQFYQEHNEIIATGKGKVIEYPRLSSPVDEARPFLCHKEPLMDKNGRVVGVTGISMDITNFKKATSKAGVASESEFIANMSRDLRAPLTEIVGLAETIKKETTDLRVKEYADNLIKVSHVPLRFFNGTLGAIKVLTGDIPTVKRKFQLADITKKIIQLVRPKVLEKKLNMALNFDEKIPQYVIGDPTRIQCILLELVSNALNFTEKGHISINIDLARKQARELVIKCAVKDTGIGMPADKQEDIFLRFKRLIPSYRGIYTGAGLGLTVLKQFVDDIKGEIYCQSKEGVGSNFICLIPMQAALLDDDTGIADLAYG